MRTVIVLVIGVPIIVYLVSYSIERHKQFDGKAAACQEQCTAQGYLRVEFTWAPFRESQCTCQ